MSRFASPLRYALVGLFLAACGGSPDLIDRTQPNYIRKADLLNATWYMQETVVEVPPTSAMYFEGLQGGLEKVRLEIQEGHLVAFRSYELLPGADPQVDREKSRIGSTVTLDGKPYRGAPLAAWKIESHFDRVRQYNAATGEQSNVLEENTSDRPWYEREFIRVDWGSNSLYNPMLLTNADGVQAAEYVQPIDQNPGEDAFFTEYGQLNGREQLKYFDFVSRLFVDPRKVYYPGYGEIPYCWFNPRHDCEGAEVRIRTSLLRVDPVHEQDYEPLVYDDSVQKKFGFFRTERVTYDRGYGSTDSGRILYANRHNIWKKSRNADGSPIPVADRTPQPVVYHLSPNFPKELLPAVTGDAESLEAGWDQAFRRAVAVPRGQQPEQVQKMFFICPTPVEAGAPPECGPVGTTPRMGDLRFNVLWWVDRPQLAGPLGYGPSGADPETGEIIQAGAYMYGAGVDTWTGDAQTVMEVIAGELTVDQLLAGKHIRDFAEFNWNPTDPRRPLNGPWASNQSGLTNEPEQPQGAFARVTGRLAEKVAQFKQKGALPIRKENRREVVAKLIAQNPELEAEVINAPEVRAFVLANAPGRSYRQALSTDPALYRKVARDVMLRFDEIDRMNKLRMDKLSRNCVWMAEFSDDSMYGLAKEMAALFQQKKAEYQAAGKPEAEARALAKNDVWNKLRIAGFRGVAEHEVGHTVGLRHNFAGSFDALNYKDGYWELRKQTIGVKVGGNRVLPLTPQDLLDASKPNQAQIDGKMREFQYSTVMDYGSRMNSDVHGLGKYDEAAILFAYAGGGELGWVELLDDNRGFAGTTNQLNMVPTTNAGRAYRVRGAHAEFPLANVEHYTPVSNSITDRYHYSTLPFMFSNVISPQLNFEQAIDQGLDRMKYRSVAKWSEVARTYELIEAELRKWNLSGKTYTSADWDRGQAIVSTVAAELNLPKLPVEVPYMFCTDDHVGFTLYCNRYDQGADYYEITRDWIERYENYYVFSHFKRDRFEFSPNGVLSRNYSRLLGNLPNVYHNWFFDVFYYAYYYGYTQDEIETYGYGADPMVQNYWTMAVVDGTNTLLQNLATPSAGYHGLSRTTNRWVRLPNNKADSSRMSAEGEAAFRAAELAKRDASNQPVYTDVVYVPRGPGRSMFTMFENDGYDFFTRTQEVGHFWDQYASLMAVTQSETNVLGVDKGGDALSYSLPFYLVFDQELNKVFGGVWTEDGTRYGPSLVKNSDGTAQVAKPVYVRAETVVADFVYPPPNFGVPTSSGGTPLPSTPVDPVQPWSSRFYTQLFGMAYFTENYNQDYANQNQIFRLGSGESVSVGTGFSLVTFDDPFGGSYSYAAVRNDATAANLLPAAPALILSAQAQKAKWDAAKAAPSGQVDGLTAAQWEAKLRETVRSFEMMRGLYSVFGTSW